MRYFVSNVLLFLASLSTPGCSIYKDSILIHYDSSSQQTTVAPLPSSIAEALQSRSTLERKVVEIPSPASTPTSSSESSAHPPRQNGNETERLILKPAPVKKTDFKTVMIEACDRIKPPVIGQIPKLTAAQIDAIATSKTNVAAVELLNELEKIYKYASLKTEELEQTFAKQLQSCRKVRVIKE